MVDTITHHNMTDEEYIDICAKRAREEARKTLEVHLKPYAWIDDYFAPNNMTRRKFNELKKEMEAEV